MILLSEGTNSIAKSTIAARSIISAAEHQSAEIIAVAKQDAEKIKELAYRDGFREAMSSVGESIAAFVDKEKQQLFSSKKVVLALALRIAEEVVATAVQVDKASLLRRIERALSLIGNRSAITLVVNPNDKSIVEQQKLDFYGKAPSLQNLRIVEDESLSTGSARLETASTKIAIDPSRHLQRYRDSISGQGRA